MHWWLSGVGTWLQTMFRLVQIQHNAPKMNNIEDKIYNILKRHEELTLEEMKKQLKEILFYFEDDKFNSKEEILRLFSSDCITDLDTIRAIQRGALAK